MAPKCSIKLTKKIDLFNALSAEKIFPTNFKRGSKFRLKNIQDFVILSKIKSIEHSAQLNEICIGEIGGDQSRIADLICDSQKSIKYDIIDIFDESIGRGTTQRPIFKNPNINLVECLMGTEGSKSMIKDNYYDFMISISVVEHIDWENLSNFFSECLRVLDYGGIACHCIDVKLNKNKENKFANKLISVIQDLGIEVEAPEEDWTFKPDMASQPDDVQIKWCKNYTEQKKISALTSQTCNIELCLIK